MTCYIYCKFYRFYSYKKKSHKFHFLKVKLAININGGVFCTELIFAVD